MVYPPRGHQVSSSTRVLPLLALAALILLAVCCGATAIVGYFATDGFSFLAQNIANPTPTTAVQVIPSLVAPTPIVKAPATATLAAASTAATKKPAATSAPQPTPTSAVPKSKGLKMSSPEYGVQAFLWWHPETADRDVGLARDAGFTWVKQQFAWRDIEGAAKGKYDWSHPDLAVNTANSKGVDILARIDNAPDWAAPGCYSAANKTMGPAKNKQDWVDFLTTFVKRYKGRIRAYEIWNEPNLSREWCNQPPNPAEYVALLKISYQTIKAFDPNAMIISAGLTPTSQNDSRAMPDATFVEKMYVAMNNKSDGYFDVLGVHAPGFKAPPEMSPDDVAKNPAYNNNDPNGRIYCFRHVEDIRKVMVAHNDSAKQIAILEFGWTMDNIHPAYSWFAVSESTQGNNIINAYKYAKKNWSPWIGAMFVIYLANPDWTKDNEEYWWSIDEPDGTPRGAYVGFKAMPK